MAVIESGPVRSRDTPARQVGQRCRPDSLTVLDTTEFRWFAPGPLPSDIRGWFNDSAGVSQDRCDTYLLAGRRDIGVKFRFRETLERKVRQSLGGRIELGGGLAGPVELWRKWSPAEALVSEVAEERWVDVHKSIVQRRFSTGGTEIDFASNPQVTGAECDVEVAGVTVGAAEWWSFAFAAFGPLSTRRIALLASWRALIADNPCPEPFGPRSGRAMGYPEWLAFTFSADSDGRVAGRREHDDLDIEPHGRHRTPLSAPRPLGSSSADSSAASLA